MDKPGTNTNSYSTSLNTDFKEMEYNISARHTVGSSPFFYKPAGVIRPDQPYHINWWLHVNRDQNEFLSDIEIVDTIKSGQSFVFMNDEELSISNLDARYFEIRRNQKDSSETLTVEEFVNKGYGTFEFIDHQTFKIVILKEGASDNAEYVVQYKTKITESGKYQSAFYNDAIGTYTDVNGDEVVVEQLDRSAENVNKGGMIAPAKGVLRIVKFATHKTMEEPLANVDFKLYHEDGSHVVNIGENLLTTNEHGMVDTPPLDEGKYYIQEVSAPDHVSFDNDEKHYFEIKISEDNGVELVLFNSIKTKNLEVETFGMIMKTRILI